MGSTTSDAPAPHPGPVSLPGLFTAAARFLAEFRHTEVHDDLSFQCHRGRVDVQVAPHAGTAERRRALVHAAAELLGATVRVREYPASVTADPDLWGSIGAYGHYMEAPFLVWSGLSVHEAQHLGLGSFANVVALPLDGGSR